MLITLVKCLQCQLGTLQFKNQGASGVHLPSLVHWLSIIG